MLLADVTIYSWIGSAAIIAIATVAIVVLRRVLSTLISRSVIQANVGGIVRQIGAILIVLVAALYVMSLLEIEIGPLLGALGISGVIIGLSLQPVLGNFIGSVMLHSAQPVRVGDQILSNGIEGTVIEVTNREVELLTFDGVAAHLPNLQVLEKPLINLTHDEDRRTVIPFQVGYSADLRSVQQMVTKALRGVPGLNEMPSPEVLVHSFGESGMDLAAYVWHPSEQLIARWAISEAHITIREVLAEAGVEIPFPQRVVHRPTSTDDLDAVASTTTEVAETPVTD